LKRNSVHIAVMDNQIEASVINVLCTAGGDVNKRHNEKTPVELLVETESPCRISMSILLSHGARVSSWAIQIAYDTGKIHLSSDLEKARLMTVLTSIHLYPRLVGKQARKRIGYHSLPRELLRSLNDMLFY
jgi:hypothetical protein